MSRFYLLVCFVGEWIEYYYMGTSKMKITCVKGNVRLN